MNEYNCPSCGQRKLREIIDEKVRIGETLNLKGYRGGMSKRKGRKFEIRQGWDFRRNTGDYVWKYRVVDWENNLYAEKIIDLNTGEIIKDEEGLLSDHIGHGSAKKT